MKNKIFFYAFSLTMMLFSPLFWRGVGGEASAQDKQNMTVTTQDAFYPKGEQALYTYIMYNAKYSEESKKKYAEGSVSLSFDVMPDSTVKNVKIISDVGYGVGEEVKKMVEI